VVDGYSLAFGGLLLPGGRAGDLLGRRRVFVAGLMLFSAASLAGGFATSQATPGGGTPPTRCWPPCPRAGLPEARAAMSLVRDATVVNGEIIDER
jgi:MFS family permease